MNTIIDTHAHLDAGAFDDDRDVVISSAIASGVHAIILIGYDPLRWRTTYELCERFPFLVRAVGIHPNSAGVWNTEIARSLFDEVEDGNVVAIGEIGLDFYREHTPGELQREAFRYQLRLAVDADLPVIIHQRAAEAEVLSLIAEVAPIRGVMHCFSGDSEFAAQCIDLGLLLGIGGVVTYPRSYEIRAALQRAPLDSLLLETDAPYLAPQVRRGRRNEPAYIHAAVETVAQLHALSVADIAARTTRNAETLFGPALVQARQAGMEYAECRS